MVNVIPMFAFILSGNIYEGAGERRAKVTLAKSGEPEKAVEQQKS